MSRCERALKLARQVQSRINEGAALDGLGFIAQARGQLVQAEAYYTQSLAIRREVQDRQGEGVDLYSLALIAEAHDDIDRAEALHRESLAIGIEVQDWLGVADSYSTLGEFLITQRGKREEGCTMLAEAARLYDQMGVSSGDDARETAQRLGCGTEGGGATS